jgi:hypothetical protein
MIRTAAFCLCGLVLMLSHVAFARGASFPETTQVEGHTLQLSGVGALQKWMIKGCDIALYVPAETARKDLLNGAVPRCLELRYVHSIRADQFARAAWDTLHRNINQTQLARLRPSINRLHAMYRDVKPQDCYRLCYAPGKGTTLMLNGKPLGTVAGAAFASAYFGVWLGDLPLDMRLKAKLVAGTK